MDSQCQQLFAITGTFRSHYRLASQIMSLVSGPGRGGGTEEGSPLELCVEKHVEYIKSLDTVRASYGGTPRQSKRPLTRTSASR